MVSLIHVKGALINVRILTYIQRHIQPHTRINLRLRQPNIKSQNSTGEHEHIPRQFSPNNGKEHLMVHPTPVKPGLHSAKTVPE